MTWEDSGSDETARFADDLVGGQEPVLSPEESTAVASLPEDSALLRSIAEAIGSMPEAEFIG